MTDRRSEPSIAEIAALTARLRALSAAGAAADPAERERFLAGKHALLARIAAATADTGHATREEHALDRDGPPDRADGTSPSTEAECGEIAVRLAAVRARVAADDAGADSCLGAPPDHDGLDDPDTAGWAR